MKYNDMKIVPGLLVLLVVMAGIGTTTLAAAPSSDYVSETPPFPGKGELVVRGEVVMIEGDVQIVENSSGTKKDAYLIMDQLHIARAIGDETIQFRVNERTRVDDDVRIGDMVEVLASGNGVALSIKKTE